MSLSYFFFLGISGLCLNIIVIRKLVIIFLGGILFTCSDRDSLSDCRE